jgi:hypothetical protein
MRKLLIILNLVLFINGAFANVNSLVPVKNGSEIFISVGTTGHKISLLELSRISVKDMQTLTGKRMNIIEKLEFKAAQKKLREHIKADGGFDKKFSKKIEKYFAGGSPFHVGGFLLGFLLGIIGVLIAYLIKDSKKSGRVLWAWVGFGIALVFWGTLALVL